MYRYFKIKQAKQERYGERYFRVKSEEHKVIQVCLVATTKLKRGKANTFGIYPILYSTFAVNYQSFERLDECSEEEYEIKFNEAIQQLKNHIV